MAKKQDYSKKILDVLAGKPALSMPELKATIVPQKPSKTAKMGQIYAVSRSLKNLIESGLVEKLDSPQNSYARLTKKGKHRLLSQKLDSKTSLTSTSWDGKWRVILLDLPESRKSERESLRYLLKKAGFVCLKNSAWISPYPFEFLFLNIKKDLGLKCELMIVVTQYLDPETEKEVRSLYFGS